jgi:hypothetical protein
MQNYNFTCFLYQCGSWSFALREEYRLMLSENRVMRGIFGSKIQEATGGWRKMHNVELHTCTLHHILW